MPRISKPLNLHLTTRLLAYATVAGVATKCAPPAHAEVIYTPIDRPIHSNYFLDLNKDGLDDFQITSYEFSDEGEVQVFALPGNRMVAVSFPCGPRSDSPAATPLQGGAVIRQGKPFQHDATCMAFSLYGANGPWFLKQDHYLGFAFNIDGKEHFGWARLSLGRFAFNHTATITGYAYETIPGKPIIAGDEGNSTEATKEPNTLGALALGAPGLNVWRKDQN
jgi:hypothetical protein